MRLLRHYFTLLLLSAFSLPAIGAESLEEVLARAALEYEQRLISASEELNKARETIGTERLPLVTTKQNTEDKVIGLELEITRLKTAEIAAAEEREKLLADLDTINKNLRYISALAQDSLKNVDTLLLPGETQVYLPRITALQQALVGDPEEGEVQPLFDATNLIVTRVEDAIGGYQLAGSSVLSNDNRILEGHFAILGPEVFFRAENSDLFGAVRTREGAAFPVTYVLNDWSAANMQGLFSGGEGTFLADVSGGKALRLREFEGTFADHIRKGGIVGYVIIALGAFALLASLMKIVDLNALSVDDPHKIEELLAPLAKGARNEAGKAVETLKATTRELFETGMKNLDKPKTLLEEHLFAFILRQRIRHERRLPLLTVIAAAAPLLGLLGTVVGMVKTFTLITVFGTGNAEKLSSGISEALVTTELGLIVAIPTLILHGYLSHRAQKGLARLEQYSVEFVTAAQEGKSQGSKG
jgi:biopolymer transport protein ExbB